MRAVGLRGFASALGCGALWASLAGCWLVRGRDPGSPDPVIYAGCADVEGAAAWGRAQAALQQGDTRMAQRELEACVRRCPELVRAHIAYQDLCRELGGDATATMVAFYTREGARQTTVGAYLRARLAETAYAQSNALEAILAKDGSFPWAHLSKARIDRAQGRMQEALAGYEEALRSDPDLAEARCERAQLLDELGRYEESAAEYSAYMAVRPDDTDALRAYVGVLVYRIGRLDEASQRLDQLAALGYQGVDAQMDLAAIHWFGRRPKQAIEVYLGVLGSHPDVARAALNIGLLYYEVVPQDDAERLVCWPKAQAAFEWFLTTSDPADGQEQFERTLAVPFRLRRIAERIGAPAGQSRDVPLEVLAWPPALGR